MLARLLAAFLFVLPGVAHADDCRLFGADPLEGFDPLDPAMFLDLPDPETFTAVMSMELTYLNRVYADEIPGFTKRWCDIGIQSFVIDFEVPLEDDSLLGQITRAVYVWDTSGEQVGWQIAVLGERFRCARGDDPFAATCP